MSDPQKEIRVQVVHECPAPAERVWATLVDWEQHDRWMTLTRAHGGAGTGARVLAFTGVGPVGFHDPMEITGWQPPADGEPGYCEVAHHGRIVRGRGRFDIVPLTDGRSKITWTEWVLPPLGGLGRAGWPLAEPALTFFFARSLRALGERARG
ncbi:SRPBCC family protein [Nocardiopsis ansamitocini]|uniref:SRPBCC family protein n=1 Tax=Nocardiopsis ansamitocini TaxID=1670832 RepID=A0A9W6P482_9ACTN|nr:SRPBCC family protein [Nocardiopsis ansamitocini]GLU46791.1 hypothetical protein Nans01_11420 [Nocardiopsis ansamitocini]